MSNRIQANQSIDPFRKELYAIRDQLIDLVSEHQRTCTDEDCQNHIDVIAYLAHSLGVMPSDGEALVAMIDDYQRRCPGCSRLN